MKEADALLIAIGSKVAALRKRRGLTQEQLAEHLDVSPGYLRRIERGSENLTLRSLGKLAASLDLSISDLLQRPPRAH
jgi:transcriptional regulator with XRE-family HTH domain